MANRWLVAVVLLTGCDSGWHGAEPVDDRPHRSVAGADPFPAAAMAGQRPIVVWGAVVTSGFTQTPGTWARWHDGTSWSDIAQLGDRTQRPALVASENGTALARVTDGISHFDGSSWSAPTVVDLGSNPVWAMDGSGNGLAVGRSDDELVVTPFDASAGWGRTTALADAGTSYQLAMSQSGAAIVVWSDGIDIRARLRSALGIWSTIRTVDTGCSPVAVRMFGADQSVVLAACGASLRLLRSTAFGGFLAAGETPHGGYAQLAVNQAGGALVAAVYDRTLKLIHAPPAMPFAAPLIATTSLISPAIGSTFGITLDANDNGHILYSEYEGVSRLKGREFIGNSRTLSDVFIADRSVGSAYYPSVAGAENGNAIVAWNQSGPNPEEIWANLYY
jgi:hypothetical protein